MINWLKNASQYILLIVITGYIFFLIPYFLNNKMRIQNDENQISIFFIFTIIPILLSFVLFAMIYVIDRILKIKQKQELELDSFSNFDFIIALSGIISIPFIFLPIVSLFSKNNMTIVMALLFGFSYLAIPVSVYFWRKKYTLFIKRFLISIQIIYVLFFLTSVVILLKLDIFKALPMIVLSVLIILEYLYQKSIFLNDEIQPSLSILSWYVSFQKQLYEDNKYLKKIFQRINNIYVVFASILLTFLLWDKVFNLSTYSLRVTEGVLNTLNIGMFEGQFYIKKDIGSLLDINSSNKSDKYLQVHAFILWSSNMYLFFKDTNNQTIVIKKSDLASDVKPLK